MYLSTNKGQRINETSPIGQQNDFPYESNIKFLKIDTSCTELNLAIKLIFQIIFLLYNIQIYHTDHNPSDHKSFILNPIYVHNVL